MVFFSTVLLKFKTQYSKLVLIGRSDESIGVFFLINLYRKQYETIKNKKNK